MRIAPKLNIWIFSANSPGTYISVCKRRLFFVVSAFICIFAGVVGFGASALFEYQLRAELSAISSEFDSTAETSSGSEKIRSTLSEDLIRVRRYERELRHRAEMLQTILEEVKFLDINQGDQSAKLDISSAPNLGIGGDDEEGVDSNISEETLSLEDQESATASLLSLVDYRLQQVKALPLGAPVNGRFSSGYGYRRSPFSGRHHLHKGIDIAVDWQSPVVATGDGVVIKAGYKGAYGRTVVIKHGDRVETLFGHLTKIFVKEGQKICRGQKIGLVGSTGRSTGPHLHYEVRVNGKAKDPMQYIELANRFGILDSKSLQPS